MKFNNYLWNIYKESADYKEACKHFENFNTIDSYLKLFKEDDDEGISLIKNRYNFFENKNFEACNARDIFTSWIEEGIQINKEDESDYFIKCQIYT